MVHTVLGSSWLPDWFLSALCPAVERGLTISWIDAGKGLDRYRLGRAARDGGADPDRVRNRVRVSRPDSADAFEGLLADVESGEPVVLADPLAWIYDEELPEVEARRAAERLAEALRRRSGPCVMLAVDRCAPPARAALGEAVLKASDRVVSLAERDGPLSLAALGCAELSLA